MRRKNGYRILLLNFIVDAIAEMPGLPEYIPNAELEKVADKILQEMGEHMTANLDYYIGEVTQ